MKKATFRALFRAALIASSLGFVAAFLFMGDFIVDGGNRLWAALAMLPAMLLGTVLVFTRCAHCRKSLAQISIARNFDSQPDPRTLDICPDCGEPFFTSPDSN